MSWFSGIRKSARPIHFVNLALGLGLVVVGYFVIRTWGLGQDHTPVSRPEGDPNTRRPAADIIEISPQAVRAMRIETQVVGRTAGRKQTMRLAGCLSLDTNLLARVHSRFAGEVVALGTNLGTEITKREEETPSCRPLRPGDAVKRGQLLAVVWSKDLGEKKSELVEALARLKLDRDNLELLRSAAESGAIPLRTKREAEHAVDVDLIAVARAERTLKSWRVTDEEIAGIRAEAKRVTETKEFRMSGEERWARVEVRSPQDGVILEKNLNLGDIVDTSMDLFKVGDVSKLAVWAHVYEEDLPALNRLPRPLVWTINLPAFPDKQFQGALQSISAIIDPNQHTALVTGEVNNADGALRAGQFVTVTIDLPATRDELEVPAAAVVEDGSDSVVFIQPTPGTPQYKRIAVKVARRQADVVALALTRAQAAEIGLGPGVSLVSAGALHLRDCLASLPVPPVDK
ncbi:MAG: efflux RND transporter periplasmic adaptor subunit [Gemmataceae bacterium]